MRIVNLQIHIHNLNNIFSIFSKHMVQTAATHQFIQAALWKRGFGFEDLASHFKRRWERESNREDTELCVFVCAPVCLSVCVCKDNVDTPTPHADLPSATEHCYDTNVSVPLSQSDEPCRNAASHSCMLRATAATNNLKATRLTRCTPESSHLLNMGQSFSCGSTEGMGAEERNNASFLVYSHFVEPVLFLFFFSFSSPIQDRTFTVDQCYARERSALDGKEKCIVSSSGKKYKLNNPCNHFLTMPVTKRNWFRFLIYHHLIQAYHLKTIEVPK